MKKWLLFLLVLVLVYPTTGCEHQMETSKTNYTNLRNYFLQEADQVLITQTSVIFTENGTNTVLEIHKNPAITISLYPSLTTLWYEAGGSVAGTIGGSSAADLYTETIGRDITADTGVSTLATSPAARKWDIESIFALQPDLILCTTAMQGFSTLAGPASAAGVPLVAVEYNDFQDYLKWFKVFCHLTGHPELWEQVALPVLEQVVSILANLPANTSPKVLSVFTDTNSLQANTENTVLGEMLSLMHAVNIANAPSQGITHIPIQLESVYEADPDYILIQCHRGTDIARQIIEDTYGQHPVWQSLRAVREGKVYYLDKTLFHNKPNARYAEAYLQLAQILYPDFIY